MLHIIFLIRIIQTKNQALYPNSSHINHRVYHINMKINDVMTTDIVSITPETTYAEAAKIMHKHTLSSVPVTNENGDLVGILSEKDLFRVLYPTYEEFYRTPHEVSHHEEFEDNINYIRSKPISTYMTKEVITISPDEPIMKAGALMLAHHIHRLPVKLSLVLF